MFPFQAFVDYVLENLGAFTLFVLFVSLIRHISHSLRLRKQLPPGPTGLPVVGYLPFLGKEPHKDIAKLSARYGNVFTLQLGVKNVVILNDWEAVNDAFHKDAFLGRPDDGPFTRISNSISFTDLNGWQWKEHRRFALQLLRDLGFGKGSMEDRILDEIGHLTRAIDQTEGQPADIHAMLTPSMSNNICHLVFGHRYETNDPRRTTLDKILDKSSSRFSQIGMMATAPVWLTTALLKVGFLSNKKLFETVFSIFDDEIEIHKKNFNGDVQDYIDGYLAEMQERQKKNPNTSITEDKLQANCRAFFGAGSETVRTTTEWCLLLAAHFTDHQKRIQEEIDAVIGHERNPMWADRSRMPFTQAFINEMLRWKNTIPFNLMRRALEDSSILGHFIPKDTYVLANFWAVHNDPKLWDNPREFNPNRFMSDDGKELVRTETLIPFSIGKRSCVGETLGRTEVFLYFASLLQRYAIRPPTGKTISFEDKFGLSLQPKQKSILVFKKRF